MEYQINPGKSNESNLRIYFVLASDSFIYFILYSYCTVIVQLKSACLKELVFFLS